MLLTVGYKMLLLTEILILIAVALHVAQNTCMVLLYASIQSHFVSFLWMQPRYFINLSEKVTFFWLFLVACFNFSWLSVLLLITLLLVLCIHHIKPRNFSCYSTQIFFSWDIFTAFPIFTLLIPLNLLTATFHILPLPFLFIKLIKYQGIILTFPGNQY